MVLGVEVIQTGWKNSSLKRIIRPDSSTKEDLFYTVLTLTKMSWIISLITGLGLGYLLGLCIVKYLGFSLLTHAPLFIQLISLTCLSNLCNYCHHRLMHSGLLWRFHKIHHAAEHLNGITSFRNHPWDALIATPFNAIPVAVLGANPSVIGVYLLYNIAHNIALHTSLKWPANILFQNPQEHEIHHSSEARHFNKNLSLTPLFDRIFCTYYKATEKPQSIGFSDKVHNTGNPARSLLPF